MEEKPASPGRKYYFVSDSHFGVPDRQQSRIREDLFVQWLEDIREDATEIFILGDLFEFWYEYRTVIQKGYVRLLGKLAELTDQGIPIHFFRGNHDVWTFDYLEKEVGIRIYPDYLIRELEGKKFFIAHGDGLGKGDNGYKFIKKVFRNPINQWLFRWLHPDVGTGLGIYWSHKSRIAHENHGINQVNENGIHRLTGFCRSILDEYPDIDYFIFGHIHLPRITRLNDNALYISLGDWIRHFSYVLFDGNAIEIKYFKHNPQS